MRCQVRDADRIDNLLRTKDTPTAVVSRWIAPLVIPITVMHS
jgi:hypothetical protein